MLFEPTPLTQNYPDDSVGETLVDYFWFFRYSNCILLMYRALLRFSFGDSVGIFLLTRHCGAD